MTGEGSLEAPTREIIKWQDPDFADEAKLDAEMRRVFDICHGCRRCFSLCNAFPTLFDLVDATPDGEVAAAALRAGMRVSLGDGREAVVLGVQERAITAETMARHAWMRPVRVSKALCRLSATIMGSIR